MTRVARMARLVLRTGRLMLEAPARWRAPQWALAVGIAVAVVLARLYMVPLQRQIEGRGGPCIEAVAEFANLTGSGTAVTALGVGSLLLGLALRKDAIVTTSLVLAASGFWGFAFVEAGRFVFAEQRPMEGGMMRFFALGGHGVSGHAAATALLVLPVRHILLRGAAPRTRDVVTVLLALWTVVVGWSRVWLGMHFTWNVLVGGALGFWASAAAVAAWRASDPSPASGVGGVRAAPSPRDS